MNSACWTFGLLCFGVFIVRRFHISAFWVAPWRTSWLSWLRQNIPTSRWPNLQSCNEYMCLPGLKLYALTCFQFSNNNIASYYHISLTEIQADFTSRTPCCHWSYATAGGRAASAYIRMMTSVKAIHAHVSCVNTQVCRSLERVSHEQAWAVRWQWSGNCDTVKRRNV